MSTPNEVFNSNSVPHGGIYVKLYRNQAAPTLLGTYLMENATPADAGIVGERPDVDGGDNGWWIVNGKSEGPATFQTAAAVTPSIKNGDMFVTTKFSTDGNGAGETRYWAIINPSNAIGMEYRKQSCTVRECKTPTQAMIDNIQEQA